MEWRTVFEPLILSQKSSRDSLLTQEGSGEELDEEDHRDGISHLPPLHPSIIDREAEKASRGVLFSMLHFIAEETGLGKGKEPFQVLYLV